MDDIKKESTVAIRQEKIKESVLEQLRRIPILQIACEKAGVSRATFYRLRAEDEKFRTSVEEAIAEGVAFINDMSEGQLIQLIKDKNFSALQLWLRSHHPKYSNKLELTGEIKTEEKLTPEQEVLVDRALRLASLVGDGAIKNNENKQSSGQQ